MNIDWILSMFVFVLFNVIVGMPLFFIFKDTVWYRKLKGGSWYKVTVYGHAFEGFPGDYCYYRWIRDPSKRPLPERFPILEEEHYG